MTEHGKPTTYRHAGCRCDECRAAATAQTAKSRRAARSRLGPTESQRRALTALIDEDWRPVVDYPGYEVSTLGRVRSFRGRPFPVLVTPVPNRPNGYLRVRMYSGDGRIRARGVHILVAEAFLGPRPDGQEVRHLDDNRSDNRIENLLYGTPSQNQQDSLRNGTNHQRQKTHCAHGHPYDSVNTYVRKNGHRSCRACQRDRDTRRRRG